MRRYVYDRIRASIASGLVKEMHSLADIPLGMSAVKAIANHESISTTLHKVADVVC